MASITPVDALPIPIKKFDASAYSYDDMSKRYKLEFLSHNNTLTYREANHEI
jgi:hypothetical protein